MTTRRCPRPLIDRRLFLRASASGLAGLLAARWFGTEGAWAAEGKAPAKAKACIVLWLNGGPSHLDTFDPKPGTSTGGPFKAIKTRVPSMQLSEHLPHLAEQANHLALVRAMTSKEGNHQRAQYLLHTGYSPNPTIVHPSLGGWVSSKLGDANADLPAFVSVGGPSFGAGFLGVENGPFVVARGGEVPQNVSAPPGIGAARFDRRKAALDTLEGRFAAETGDAKVDGRRAVYAKAVRLMKSPHVKAFDVSDEPEALRTAYGDTDFGRGVLTARRLVQAGVKFVEVVLDGWDTHQDNFTRTKDRMAILDPAFGTLLRDLAAHKMLDGTLVVCMGEFGRTPRINGNDGRDHYPQAWSAALAGGGIRGGLVYGATDAEGAKVVENPVTVPQLFATLVTLLGMPLDTEVVSPIGRPIGITDSGEPVKALMT